MKKNIEKVIDKKARQIEINPKLNETVVFSWARMNPPTIGHERLVNEMSLYEGDKIIHLSHTENNKRNPLSYSDKLEYAKIAFGNIIQESANRNIADSLKELGQKYKEIILVVGDDRIEEFSEMFEKYNKEHFCFETWHVVSCGERNPDTSGVSSVSATALREAFIVGDYDRIFECLPESLHNYASQIQDKIYEAYDIAEALTIAQRIKRGQVMKRHKEILKVTRKRALARRANQTTFKKRAKRDATAMMKKRLSGGRSTSDLSYADKSRIEDLIKKRKGVVKRLATRLINKERDKENARFASKNKK